MPNPGHSRNDNTCIFVLAMTKRYATPPEQAMRGVMMDLYRMRKPAVRHQRAMKQDVIDRCTMADAWVYSP